MTSLTTLTSAVLDRSMAIDAQIRDWELRAEKVAQYRNYYDGDHPANMTAEMRRMLRVSLAQNSSEFANNQCQIIVDTQVDRTALDAIEGDSEAATKWLDGVWDANSGDELQGDITDATIRDGDTFLMASWDNDEKRVIWTHELAYDGTSGVLALYKSNDLPEMEAAIKVWVLTAMNGVVADTVRINVYYPDRITKWISQDGNAFMPYDDPDMAGDIGPGAYRWIGADGQPLGIPVIHFKNRGRQNQGLSELENVVPLQNALNRLLHSIIMTSELAAFPIKWIVGAPAAKDITPGMIMSIGENGLTPEQAAAIKLGQWEAADMNQQIGVAKWLVSEMYRITHTPAPDTMGGDNASGEALKQRIVGLIGKVRRFQVKAGNAWERLAMLSWRIEEAFGTRPAAATRFYAKWADPELRNDTETVENALKIKDVIGAKYFLRIIAPIYGWDAEAIEDILKQTRVEAGQKLAQLAGNLPSFGAFNEPETEAAA